jgi:hypothetical protein
VVLAAAPASCSGEAAASVDRNGSPPGVEERRRSARRPSSPRHEDRAAPRMPEQGQREGRGIRGGGRRGQAQGDESGRGGHGGGGGAQPPRRASSLEWEWIIWSGDERSGAVCLLWALEGRCFGGPIVLHMGLWISFHVLSSPTG